MRKPTAMAVSAILLVAGIGARSLEAAPALEAYGVPAIHKIGRDEKPSGAWQAGAMAISCARNESESFQIVVRATAPLAKLAIAPGELRLDVTSVLSPGHMRVHKVEWVDINAPYELDQPSAHPDFRADPLPPVDPSKDVFAVEAGRNLVFWVSVAVPSNARPGHYRGRMRILAGAEPAASLAVDLHVRNFALPKRPILQSMIGLATGNIYKAHGCKTTEEKEKIVRLYFEEYIRARLSPFLYATGTMAFNPLPDGCIKWEFAKDANGKPTGEATLDFTGFDREGAYYLGQRDAFSAFNFAPYIWSRPRKGPRKDIYLRFRDEKGTVVKRRRADGSTDPVFDRLVVSVFRQIAAHLAEKGWLDRAIYYVTDEPGNDETPALKVLCQLVRQADPRIRTAMTYDPANRPRLAELVDEKGRSLVSVWIPYCTRYRESVADAQRAKGADYWLYDVKATSLISHTGQENRAMFWDVWRRGAKGYLYYLSTYWGREATPWERPNFLLPGVTYRYRHGDGYFFYPPLRKGAPKQPILDHVVPTIRWELMREGAEDYDYLRMLEALTAQAEKRKLPAAAKGRQALKAAHAVAHAMSGPVSSYAIRDLEFQARQMGAGAIPGSGWSFNADEGWLHHRGGKRSDLPIRVRTALADGRYELVLRVYDDTDYRGRPYSRLLLDGRPYASPGSSLKGQAQVPTGVVTVREGVCTFTLSSVGEGFGVILYGLGLKELAEGANTDLYAVRAIVADAIEALQE